MAYDIDLIRSIAMVEPDPTALEYRGKSRVVQPTYVTLPEALPEESPSRALHRFRRANPPEEATSNARPDTTPPSLLDEADADLGPQP